MKSRILHSKFIKLSVLFVALAYSLLSYFWWIGYADHYYWMLLSKNPEYDYMEILSLFIIQKWTLLFGYTQISVRILAWLTNAITVLIPYMFLIKKEYRWNYLYALSAAFVILGAGIHKLCNPDVFTALCFSVVFTYITKHKDDIFSIKNLLVLIILSSLSISIRFPNILIVPWICLVFLVLNEKWSKKISCCLVLTCSSLFLYYLILTVCTSDFNCISTIFLQMSNTDGDHSIKLLFFTLVISLIRLYPIAIVIALFLVWYVLKSKIKPNRWMDAIYLMVILLVAIYFFTLKIWMSSVGILTFLSMLFISYRNYVVTRSKKQNLLFDITTSLVIFLPILGSNTGYIKTIVVGCAMIPLLYHNVAQLQSHRFFIRTAFVFSVIFSLYIQNSNSIFGQVTEADTYMNGNINIFVSNEKQQTIKKIEQEIIPYFNKDHVVFYGGEYSHLLYFETNSKPIYEYRCWMNNNDKNQINKAINAVKADKNAYFLDFSNIDTHVFEESGMYLIAKNEYFTVYKN